MLSPLRNSLFVCLLAPLLLAAGPTGDDWNGTPTPPQAPSAYELPSGGIRVTNAAQLKRELARKPAKDIIIADGVYDNNRPFNPAAPHRLWSERLGGATFKAGIIFHSGVGAEVHGIRFDVNASAKTAHGAIILTRGKGHRTTVTDSWFEGNKTLQHGMLFKATDGVVVRRVIIRQFRKHGLRVDGWPHFGDPAPQISDVDVYWIRDPNPNCCKGTSEFGILIRAVVPGGIVERAKARWMDWSCFLPIDAKGMIWRDLDCDWARQAFYIEHYTDGQLIERFSFGPNIIAGLNIEGALPNWHWRPSGERFTIQDGTMASVRKGVTISACNRDVTVQRVKFVGQCYVAVIDNTNHPSAAKHCSGGPVTLLENDYSQILSGARAIANNVPQFGGHICGEAEYKALHGRFPR